MQKNSSPIVIIGSGLAGYMLAKEFRKIDSHTSLQIITSSDGRFYSKPQLSTALTAKKTANELAVASATEMSQQLNAVIRTHTRVTAIDPKEQCVYSGDEKINYSRLVLAMGADVIKPPINGNAANEIFSVNDLEDYARFRQSIHDKKHLIILGAGLVGCEFANDLSNSRHKVEVVALSNYPVDGLLPEKIGVLLQTALEEIGVIWHLKQTVKEINHYEKGYKITLSSDDSLVADIVLSAIGLRPHTNLAAKTGIKISRGIVVDQTLQTSEKNIYALGDCAEVNNLVLLFVAPLLNCARALAKTLAGEVTKVDYPAMPVSIKTPACPIVVYPQPKELEGTWTITGTGKNLKALFHDKEQQLRGFALTGTAVTEKLTLMKQLPSMF